MRALWNSERVWSFSFWIAARVALHFTGSLASGFSTDRSSLVSRIAQEERGAAAPAYFSTSARTLAYRLLSCEAITRLPILRLAPPPKPETCSVDVRFT